MVRFSSTFGEINDALRNATFCLSGDLELDFDCPQDLARLRRNRIRAVWHDVVMLQIGEGFPEHIFQAASRQGANDGYDAPLDWLHAYAVAPCYGCLLGI